MKKQIEVTAAIIVKNGKVFAARRRPGIHLAGLWEFPGGKLEAGETPEQCLVRELQEEFAISARVGVFIGESVYDYGSKIVRLMAYQVEHLTGDFKLIDHDELRWLSLDELNSVEWAPADIPLIEQYLTMANTAAFYQSNAQAYCDETSAFDVSELYKPFLDQLFQGANILDLGCGSGRDSKVFLEKGYSVTAVDGSAEVAACAAKTLGRPVEVTTFQELSHRDTFDGVWACASLLHCPRQQILPVINRIHAALKPCGVAYLSFKWGDDESVDDRGRYFNNYTLNTLQALIDDVTGFSVVEIWSENKRLRGNEQKWACALIKKDIIPQ
jgi:mutator protein MutT